MKVDLLSYVTGQLHAFDGSLAQLARDAGVKQSWLSSFYHGGIPNPGVRQIQRLADYFDSLRVERNRPMSAEVHLGQ